MGPAQRGKMGQAAARCGANGATLMLQRIIRGLRGPFYVGKRPEGSFSGDEQPDWLQANPARIQKALAWTRALPDGGWYVLAARRKVGLRPQRLEIDGRFVVAWRDETGFHAAPEACPHMGASLHGARVSKDALICPWHGLALASCGHGAWKHFPLYDDGVLLWIRMGKGSDAPFGVSRPERYISAVIELDAQCEAQDVIANRLDPWHGAHFHPYSFAKLNVLSVGESRLTLRVSYRIAGPWLIEVDASFHSPNPRAIVMTIIGGEGRGSLVETHVRPLGQGRTKIIEATIATSDRPGFRHALRLARWIVPYIERSAKRLWVDDLDYAQRLYALRSRPADAPGARMKAVPAHSLGQAEAPRLGLE
jgi:isorenieratene synthase